jgi:hypothetical protein
MLMSVITGFYTALFLPYIFPYEKIMNYFTQCKCGICHKKNRSLNYTKQEYIKYYKK